MEFEKSTFGKRLKSMLAVDFKRAFTTKFFYIVLGIAFAVPVLILVMTTAMDGTVTVNPQTGEPSVIEGFDTVWQIIGSAGGAMQMGLTGMCNINMAYFGVAVFVCLFVSDDFRSGYAKNLFAVRATKGEYALSKTLLGFICGTLVLVAFFLGSMLGGAVAGLPFDLDGVTDGNIFACMLAKIFLLPVFVSVAVLAGTVGKQKAWLAVVLSFAFGALLFTVIPIVTPLDAGFAHILLTLVGGVAFGFGIGAVSRLVLKKTDLV